jgi:hypothetical protein
MEELLKTKSLSKEYSGIRVLNNINSKVIIMNDLSSIEAERLYKVTSMILFFSKIWVMA